MALGCQILANGLPDPTLAQPAIVEVTESVGETTTWSLLYDVQIVDGDIGLLSEDRLGPEANIAIRVTDGDATTILVSGPVTQQRISIVTGGEGSQLEVVGGDVTVPLAREAKVKVWPSVSDAGAMTEILSTAAIDVSDIVIPNAATHTDHKNALVQREPDLHLVRRLARRNGCWFWISYDALTALPAAHVKRPPVGDPPAFALHIAGAERNIDDAVIEWNVERVVATDADNRDGFSSSDQSGGVDRSPLSPLGGMALADIVKGARRARLSIPVDDAGDLISRSEAALIDEGWFVTATVTARARRIKHVLRAPSVITLHGAGKRHSGNYLIQRVVHRIDDDDHLMTATLVRNGWN